MADLQAKLAFIERDDGMDGEDLLAFLVDDCDGDDLTSVMAQIVGKPERQDAIKAAIERRQNGEVG